MSSPEASTAQVNIFGEYVRQAFGTGKIDIQPNGYFTYTYAGSCGLVSGLSTEGFWRVANDTLFLLSKNNSVAKTLIILQSGDIADVSDTAAIERGHVKFGIFFSDTTITGYWRPFKKTKAYYETGELEWVTQLDDNSSGTYEYLYKSGAPKITGTLKKGKPKGQQIYYDAEGQIERIEFYRRDKLQRTKYYKR